MENPILMLLFGIAFTYFGYGPLSMKKHPKAGIGFAVAGFVLRCAGPVILVWGILSTLGLVMLLFVDMP
jgi:hypothetical protein